MLTAGWEALLLAVSMTLKTALAARTARSWSMSDLKQACATATMAITCPGSWTRMLEHCSKPRMRSSAKLLSMGAVPSWPVARRHNSNVARKELDSTCWRCNAHARSLKRWIFCPTASLIMPGTFVENSVH